MQTNGLPGARRSPARRLALAGLAFGLLPPLVLLVPIFYYEMHFMLYTWAWPTLCGAAGVFLSALGLRRAAPGDSGRVWALGGLVISLLTTGLALAGWIGMILTMLAPMDATPMSRWLLTGG